LRAWRRGIVPPYGVSVDPAEVVVTTGSSAAFQLAFLAAFEPDDRVGLAVPGYPALPLAQCAALEAVIREVDREADARIAALDDEEDAAQAPFCEGITRLSAIPGWRPGSSRRNRPRRPPGISSPGRVCVPTRTRAPRVKPWAEGPRQEEIDPIAQRRSLAEDDAGAMRPAAERKKGSYYRAQFFRLQSRRGSQKAVCAVAASLLTTIYHMVKHRTLHRDLGAAHLDRRSSEAQAKRLLADPVGAQ